MKNNNGSGDRSFVIGRRELVLGTTAALLLSSRIASSQTTASSQNTQPKIIFNDHLAVPIPANPSFGKGKDRALVLGGGGEYFAAWMLGFAYGLDAKGVPYAMPDVIVGTSAGSVVGSAIAGGHLKRLTREFDFFGRFPNILAALVPRLLPIQAKFVPESSVKSQKTPASRQSSRLAVGLWPQKILPSPSFKR